MFKKNFKIEYAILSARSLFFLSYMKLLIFFNWDSLCATLNSNHQAWSYKKKKKKLERWKVNRKANKIKRKHFAYKEFQSIAV